MAKPPECSNCKKPATIHLTQIVNNEVKKLDFCESCPYQKGVTDPEGFSLAEMLTQVPTPFAKGETGEPLECPSCGFRPQLFKKHHRFGCPDCYESLKPFAEPMVANMQAGTKHVGKVPNMMLERVERLQVVEQLRMQLNVAIAEERYEDAAKLRDQIASKAAPDTDLE